MMKRAIAAGLATMLFAAALAPTALGAAITRAEYKAMVEPICKANSDANDRILKNVRKEVKQDKLKPAGAKFIKASNALKKTHAQLLAVPQPDADEAKLAKWLGYVKKEADLFKKAGDALKAENKSKAQKFVNQLTTNANQANSQVLAFGFRYCKFEPSKYT
jgi:hypothetical protein